MHEAQEQRPQLRLRTTALSSSVTASSSQASLEQRQPSQRQPSQSCKRVAVQPDVDQHKAELHGRGYTIVSHQFSRQRCRQLLSAAARENYDGTNVAIDESRLALFSRFCSFVVTMLCKPIKEGCTVYCAVFESGYLYDWVWFTGAGQHGRAPAGQPIDGNALDEDDPLATGYIIPLVIGLLAGKFVGTLATVYLDKAFTSIRLARTLDEQGVALVGMQKTAGRPKATPRGSAWYWPFPGRTKADESEYARGERREAYTPLPSHSRLKYLKAELWLDLTWVTLTATAWFSATPTTVLRWTAEAFARLPRNCSATLARYAKLMGCVDRFNKMLSATNMAMGRCKQRFHRALFLAWLLPAIGVINVMIVFLALWPADELKELKKSRHCSTLGFNRWFQQQLGEALIARGIEMAKAEQAAAYREEHPETPQDVPDAELCAEAGLSPLFMPQDRQRKATGFEAYTFPTNHKEVQAITWVENKRVFKFGSSNYCARCYALAEREGPMGWYHTDGRDPSQPNPWVRKMPDGISNVPRASWGCSICKVYLCRACFRMQDAEGKPHPDAWDHRPGSRGLMARAVAVL